MKTHPPVVDYDPKQTNMIKFFLSIIFFLPVMINCYLHLHLTACVLNQLITLILP